MSEETIWRKIKQYLYIIRTEYKRIFKVWGRRDRIEELLTKKFEGKSKEIRMSLTRSIKYCVENPPCFDISYFEEENE